MIYDSIKNIDRYKHYPLIYKALEAIKTNEFKLGKTTIDADNVFINMLEAVATSKDKDYEAHRKYIDIFYVIQGEEYVDVSKRELCTQTVEYNESSDIEFLSGEKIARVKVFSDMFVVLFPEDLHKPALSEGEDMPITKIVGKVRYSGF